MVPPPRAGGRLRVQREKENLPMSWFTDSSGTTGTTNNGLAPGNAGVQATISNPNGSSVPAIWNGSQFVPAKND